MGDSRCTSFKVSLESESSGLDVVSGPQIGLRGEYVARSRFKQFIIIMWYYKLGDTE